MSRSSIYEGDVLRVIHKVVFIIISCQESDKSRYNQVKDVYFSGRYNFDNIIKVPSPYVSR